MTPERLREIIAATGRSRHELARMLGYASEASLRQAESGRALLPDDKALWLEGYASLREFHATEEAEWLEQNPPPNKNND